MAGMNLISKIEYLKEECDKLGFVIGWSKSDYNKEFGDVVALYPKDTEALPTYSRDAQLFVGSIDHLAQFLRGVNWAREYDMLLFGVKHDDSRSNREQKVRNRALMNQLKDAQ